jgi:hypothetical protein
MTQAMSAAIRAEWNGAHSNAAHREGWCLSECDGSMYGPLQVQRLDSPEDAPLEDGTLPPYLASEDVAHALVKAGTQPHHAAALDLLRRFNPDELDRVMGASDAPPRREECRG